jgi:single-stranded-DNA-specific exonuclease
MEFNNSDKYNDIDSYLESFGLDPNDFSFGNYDEFNPDNIVGLDRVVAQIQNAIDNKYKIGIVLDMDVDGLTSTSIFHRTLTKIKKDKRAIAVYIHPEKAHGLNDDVEAWCEEKEIQLLIVPDAGSSNTKEIDDLLMKGIEVSCIDHHFYKENGVSQKDLLDNHPNTYSFINGGDQGFHLTGSGMSYMVCSKLTELDKYDLELAALGQIGDCEDVSIGYLRTMCLDALAEIKMPLLKQLQGEYTTIHDCSFGIISMANAVIRVGTPEERQMLFKAFIGAWSEDDTILVESKRRKDYGLEKPAYEELAYKFNAVKSRQKGMVDRAMRDMDVYEEDIVIAVLGDEKYGALTGLIANKIQSSKGKPALVVLKREKEYSGSSRIPEKFKNEASFFDESDAVNWKGGHILANGLGFNDIDKLLEASKGMFPNTKGIEVDKLYNGLVSFDDAEEVITNMEVFGGRVEIPKFGYNNIEVPLEGCYQKGTVLMFTVDNLTFVKFGTQPGLLEDYPGGVILSCYGSPSDMELFGSVRTRIIMEDMELEPLDEFDDDWDWD